MFFFRKKNISNVLESENDHNFSEWHFQHSKLFVFLGANIAKKWLLTDITASLAQAKKARYSWEKLMQQNFGSLTLTTFPLLLPHSLLFLLPPLLHWEDISKKRDESFCNWSSPCHANASLQSNGELFHNIFNFSLEWTFLD